MDSTSARERIAITTALKQHFGHSTFRAGQEQVIQTLLEGRSALAIFPTGGGKSLCYQLPALLLPSLTVVVSPLIALMKDQVDALNARGLPAARLDSTLSIEELQTVYERMQSGTLKLLYIAPERLLNEKFVDRLKSTPIDLLAVDESHCISEWGHNFRPEYLRLAKMAKKLRIKRILALTATATPSVAEEICRQFHIAPHDRVQTPFHRSNLALHRSPVEAKDRLAFLTTKLQKEKRFPAIVYATLQATTEEVATHLAKLGLKARAYHAGLSDEVRASAQEDFMTGRIDIIVATIAFGMGIDKADIRSVYHYNLPKTLENYQQEIGRAGRDGAPAHCEMLPCADDLIPLQNFTLGDTPEETSLRSLIDHLLRQGTDFDISRYDLSRSTDIRPLVLETVLTYLEQDGILEPLGPFYNTLKVGFKQNEARILQGHTTERQQFLTRLFASGKRGHRWLTLNIDTSIQSTGATRERILKALGYLEEMGDIELQPSGLRHRFRLLPAAALKSPREVATQLLAVFSRRETRDLARLDEVIALASASECITNHLLRYFGEIPEADCGHCENCLHPKMRFVELPASPIPDISLQQLQVIRNLQNERHPALRSPRQLARFLCGISSPAVVRDRLSRHDDFGLLTGIPFLTVLEQVTSNHL